MNHILCLGPTPAFQLVTDIVSQNSHHWRAHHSDDAPERIDILVVFDEPGSTTHLQTLLQQRPELIQHAKHVQHWTLTHDSGHDELRARLNHELACAM